MSKARICDRCGRMFAEGEFRHADEVDESRDVISPHTWFSLHMSMRPEGMVDLCPSCAHEFWVFMGGHGS